jgi:hypothetical protein
MDLKIFNKSILILMIMIAFSGCSHQMISKPLKKTNNMNIDNKINFIGIGIGINENKENAYKIAKLKALGNLSENIEIDVLSVLEYYSKEKNTDEVDETIKKQIGIISSTKIRDPIYIINEENHEGLKYHYEIIAKKNRNEYINETASDLNFNTAGEMLLEMFKNKFNK